MPVDILEIKAIFPYIFLTL